MPPERRPLVVHVVQHLVRGGIETMTLELLRRTPPSMRGMVISLEGERSAAIDAWPALETFGDRLVWLGKKPGLDRHAVRRLATRLAALKAHCVHTHHIGPLFYGGLAARLAGVVRHVHTEHDAWHLDRRSNRLLQGGLLRILDPVYVADSGSVAERARYQLAIARPRVIMNGVDLKRFSPGCRTFARRSLALPIDARLVGCAARLESVKGIDLAVRAIAELPEDCHLAIAGAGSEEAALRGLARTLTPDLGSRVHFLGALDDMPVFYQALDVFCLPSRSEGLPMALLEAQASGLPVVATRVGGVPAAVDPASGALVPAGDRHALATALATTLGRDCRVSPRAFIEGRFDAEAMAAAYARLWREAANPISLAEAA
jgi:glycosyltransferase involved in cell wall biosynthesis